MIWQLGADRILPAEEVTFSAVGIKERSDLQRLLRDNISVVSPAL
jgi:hypothetical protein